MTPFDEALVTLDRMITDYDKSVRDARSPDCNPLALYRPEVRWEYVRAAYHALVAIHQSLIDLEPLLVKGYAGPPAPSLMEWDNCG